MARRVIRRASPAAVRRALQLWKVMCAPPDRHKKTAAGVGTEAAAEEKEQHAKDTAVGTDPQRVRE